MILRRESHYTVTTKVHYCHVCNLLGMEHKAQYIVAQGGHAVYICSLHRGMRGVDKFNVTLMVHPSSITGRRVSDGSRATSEPRGDVYGKPSRDNSGSVHGHDSQMGLDGSTAPAKI